MTLTVSNQGQPFMKVGLPQGATLLSAEVAGVSVKPVVGADGARVPLLRTGFRPSGRYTVSFVYLQSGAAYAKKGDAQMSLAKLDLPINLLEWELFLPEGFRVKRFDGDVLPKDLVAMTLNLDPSASGYMARAVPPPPPEVPAPVAQDGLNEVVVDGRKAAAPARTEAVTVQAEPNAQAPSVNVQNLQRRIAGVLPVRIDVPRAGTSYMFVRPIVIDEETTVRFAYRARS
jgi:hypothetical protein